MSDYLNKWMFYPWLKNNNLDYLIDESDLDKIDGLGIVLCIDEDENYITVKNKQGVFRVRKEGVKRLLPIPKFIWGDEVFEELKPEVKALIDDFFWHHNKEQYLFYISVNGKKKTKQLFENQLKKSPI
jgi:late competence protein required for DNA uptake (superfamily II DNA/RNA helicase)